MKPVRRCTILEIGDSLGSDLGWGLTRHLSAASGLHLVQLDTPSTGLANSWFFGRALVADPRILGRCRGVVGALTNGTDH